MSTQRKPDYVEPAVSERAVTEFLRHNPGFFEHNVELLDTLRLPHVTGGTVSLVERQVSVLRQKDLKMERKLKELLEVARSNDVLAAKIHQLTLSLLAAGGLQETLEVIEHGLRTGFDADQSILVLFGDPDNFGGASVGRFFRPIERDDAALAPFATFLQSNSPRCGQVRDAQRDFLFGEATNEIGSVALLPLGRRANLGFLAIGSADADRFHPGVRVDFLARIGELVSGALKRF